MSQVKLIVSNWKMNLNISQARILTNKLKKIKIKKNLNKKYNLSTIYFTSNNLEYY